jgi:hypothetical protein
MLGVPDVGGGSWTQVEGPEQAMLNDAFDPNTGVNIGTYGVYRFVWMESENGCDAFDTVNIGFRPDPQLGTIDTLCGGDATDFVVQFDIQVGQAPYTVISGGGMLNGNQYVSDTIPDNTPTTIVIQDSFGCELVYFIDYDCECPNEIGTVSADTLAFCGTNDQACIDYNRFGQVLDPGIDTLMFVLYTTPGDVEATEIQRSTDGCFNFDPMTMNMDQVYFLAAVIGKNDGRDFVDYAGGCVKIAEGQPVIWHEQPAPNAGTDENVCGQLTSLAGVTSVTGSTYRWQNTAGISINDPNDLNTSLTLQGAFGTYQLVLEETNAICTSTDTLEITFFEIPESVNAREICVDSVNRVNYDYIVCFNIVKGQPPYTIVQGGGTIDPMTNRYCSDQLMSLQVYDIIIEDANGCQFQLTGDHNCDCGMSDPGTMDQATLESCVNQCVTVSSNGTEILQQDEVAEFILHEGSGGIILNELSRIQYDHTANPPEQVQFCFDPGQGMIAGRVYYISRLIRSATEPDDPCERLAPGTPVIWNSYPTSDAGMDQDVCGLTADLSALPSVGTGSWSIASQPVGSNVIYATDLSMQMITVDRYGTYTFQWKEDNSGCADSATVAITFHDAPRVANYFFECDDVAENYRLWIELTAGDQASYSIRGIPMQQQSANTFRTDWIATGSSISFCATDQWDCSPFCVDTSYVCECITEPGTLAGDEVKCIDECVRVVHSGGMRDQNDVLAYILHDGDATTIGSQIDCNTSGLFCFDATTMNANQTYYITAVAGNTDGSGCVDLSDRCAVQSEGVPITWFEYPAPDANASSNTFTCQTDSIEITGSNGNGLPGALNYSWEVVSGSLCPGSNSTDQNIWVCASGTYVLTIEHAESGCSSTDTVVIARDADLPTVSAGNNNEITCDQPTITLDAAGSDFGGNFLLEWIDPMGNVISNDLTVDVNEPGTYTVRVTNGMNDCSDEATVTITENTTPPTAIIDQLGQLSCQVKTIDIEATGSITQGGVRTYSWSTANGQINGPADQARINITSPGDYQVIVVDALNGCRDTNVATVIEIGNTLESMDVDAMDPTCFGRTDGMLDVNIVGGVPPLEYSLNGGPFGTSDVFTGLGPGTYSILVRDMNGCERDTTVTIIEPAEIGITAKDDLIKEAGSSVDLDTLVESVQGIQRQEADREWWINMSTGDTLNRLVIDSLTETVTYRVVIDKNGCFADDLITIFVRYTRKVFVPNVIITNGQSGNPENGILTVYGNENRIGQVNFMRVYDRWGELVYSQDNIQYDEDLNRTTEGWDGTFNGELVNPGVYVYHIEVSFLSADGNPYIEQFFGDVTVLR